MRRIPIRKVAEALASPVRAGASSFSEELKLVQVGSRASFFRTAAQILARLPAVIATPADIDLKRNSEIQQYLEQAIPIDFNLLTRIPESGEHDLAFLSDQEILAQFFSDFDTDDIQLPSEPLVEIEDVIVTGIFQHTDFQELEEPIPIAWARVRVLVSLVSRSS